MDIVISQELMELIGVSAVMAYASVEIIKPFIKKGLEPEKARALLRLSSVLISGTIGFTLTYKWQGLWMGMAAGALNSGIVAIIKSRLKEARSPK